MVSGWCGWSDFPHPLLPRMMVRGLRKSRTSGCASEYDRTPWMDSRVIVVIGDEGREGEERAEGGRKGKRWKEARGSREAEQSK